MTNMPPGWKMATLAEVAEWGSGGTPKAGNADYYENGSIPWAVIGDLNDGIVNSTATSITQAGLANSSAKIVPLGTVLVAMYGSIGKLGIAGVPLATNQAIACARPLREIESKYLFYYLFSQRQLLMAAGKGATQKNIGQGVLKRWPIPVAPLDQQRRIVETLEDHLSRLDAADNYLTLVERRLRQTMRSILVSAVPELDAWPVRWRRSTVAQAGIVDLGRQRHPDWHVGPNMRPYLRVANVFEDRIDDADVKSMHWPDELFERFRLHPGEILLNEGQSPELLGRPAIYRGQPPGVAFTNSLIRFRVGPDVLPEFALLVFRRHMHAGRFLRESRITTNIGHLSATRLKSVEFPIPPVDEQRQLVDVTRSRLDSVATLKQQVGVGRQRGNMLRRSLLNAAFEGLLSGRTSHINQQASLKMSDDAGPWALDRYGAYL